MKLFAGPEVEDQQIQPSDPDNTVQATELGLRLTAKTWYEIAARWPASADASYGSAFEAYWNLARIGYCAFCVGSLQPVRCLKTYSDSHDDMNATDNAIVRRRYARTFLGKVMWMICACACRVRARL